jgi:MFS family permease
MINEIIPNISKNNRITKKNMFSLYCFSLGIIYIVESIMGYFFPIAVERTLNSNLYMGLIIGLTNLLAILCDIVFPQLFSKKSWRFLLVAAALTQFGFPLFTHIGIYYSLSIYFIIAALFWNVYFEFFAFSRQSYIVNNESQENYIKDWGTISVIMGMASIIGPILGSFLLKMSLLGSYFTLWMIQFVALSITIIFVMLSPKSIQKVKIKENKIKNINFFKEFSFWKILEPRIYPALILGSLIMIINAAVSTIGGLLGRQIFSNKDLDWIIIFAFSVPTVLISLFFSKLKIKTHKKYFSQLMFALASLSLILLTFFENFPVLIVILFFMISLLVSGSWIFNEAVYSDLARRVGKNNLHINSMERIYESLGWLIGPIIIGFLSDKTNYFSALTILGIICLFISIILIIITPTKLRLPQKEIEKLEAIDYEILINK